MPPGLEKVFFLAGPTASGKTEVAVHLAKKLGAEIVSCDSMQIYKGMDIITSKPCRAEIKKIAHHLISVVAVTTSFDVSRYRALALAKMRDILKRGKIPLFVGGTGLYMSVLLDGIFKQGRPDLPLRLKLEKQATKKGCPYLYSRLRTVDPEAAARIHAHDLRRIIRALEVFYSTGQPISQLQRQRRGIAADYDARIFCLNPDRRQLYRRIDARAEEMFKKGLVREVKKLLKSRLSRTASSAIGIRELKAYFEGRHSLEEAKRLIKLNTRRYAKRQLSWFRRDKRIRWIDIGEADRPKPIAGRIWKECF